MITKKNNFFLEYFKNLFSKINLENNSSKLFAIVKIIKNLKKNKKKVLIFGNGGSASIASHFSVDLTKMCKIRCVNFNEANLITCFANDYGYENWVSEAIKAYADYNDVLILISSSGVSKNILNAFKEAKKKKLQIITFSGFKKNNKLKNMGKINIWIDSKNYNIVENSHQFLLLSVTEFLKQ